MYSSGKFENGALAPHRKLPLARLGQKLTVASEPARNAHERRRSTLSGHPRLYERGAFLDEIAAMFSGNWERPNGPVIIEGASWTGRTALLGAAQRLAVESGLTVLNARGNDLERGAPWGLVRQLFYSQLPWLVAETRRSFLGPESVCSWRWTTLTSQILNPANGFSTSRDVWAPAGPAWSSLQGHPSEAP